MEALKSPLMGLFEKRRARKFFIYVQDYDENDPKSHEKMDLRKVTAREVISYYLILILVPFHFYSLIFFFFKFGRIFELESTEYFVIRSSFN